MSYFPSFYISFICAFSGYTDLALMLRKKHPACQQSAQLATSGYDQTILQVQAKLLFFI